MEQKEHMSDHLTIFRQLQMAYREPMTKDEVEFYLSFILTRANPNIGQFGRAIEKLIIEGTHKMPTLGRILVVVQAIIAEDKAELDQRRRREEAEIFEIENLHTPEEIKRFRELIQPVVKRMSGES